MRREIEGIRTVMRAIADLAVPRICVCCGRRLELQENHICSPCLSDLPRCRFGKLRTNPMSETFNALIQRVDGDRYEPFSNAIALFFYRGDYRNITRALKYRRNIGAGKWASGLLADEILASTLFEDMDMVIPVPLHWWRRWHRGYNQAQVIAKVLSDRMGALLESRLLSRRRHTRSQTSLGREGRYANVRSAFCVDKKRLGELIARGKACRILIVDDVFTTGATLAACSHALRDAMMEISPEHARKARISIATLAAVIP